MKVIHNTNKNNELDDFWQSKLETLVENDKNAFGNFSKLI